MNAPCLHHLESPLTVRLLKEDEQSWLAYYEWIDIYKSIIKFKLEIAKRKKLTSLGTLWRWNEIEKTFTFHFLKQKFNNAEIINFCCRFLFHVNCFFINNVILYIPRLSYGISFYYQFISKSFDHEKKMMKFFWNFFLVV